MGRKGKEHLPKSDRITIKKSKKSNITKFKLRTPKYLLTLKVEDRNKAQRIMDSIHQISRRRQKNEQLAGISLAGAIDVSEQSLRCECKEESKRNNNMRIRNNSS